MSAPSPIDWATVQGAIVEWMVESTGLECAWVKQPRRPQTRKPMATLGFLGAPRRIHRDYIVRTLDEDTGIQERTLYGIREFTIQAQAFTDSVLPEEHAMAFIERAQTCLQDPDHLARFRAAGVAVVTSMEPRDLSDIAGADWQSRVSFDVMFRVTSGMALSPLGTIAKVNHTLKLDYGNDGEPIVVPEPEEP